MSFLKKISLLLFVLLLVFVAHTLISTGFFRTVENQFDGEIIQKISLPGVEDITVSLTDSFALLSSTDRAAFPATDQEIGGLYFIDLKNNPFNAIHKTADFPGGFAPHGISLFKKDSTYKVIAINHTTEGDFIAIFNLDGERLTYEKSLTDPSMIRPNDLVMIDENRFYFTNDHGYIKGISRLIEEYGGLSLSNVVYYDGEKFREVAGGIAYANGINFDAKRNLLFVSSPRGFLVKVYSRNSDGSLEFIENIPCGTGVDNIEFDAEGNLWVGCHPSLLRFAAYAKGKKETSPSEIIKINYRGENDYTVEKIYIDDGSTMSASSVAAPFGNLIFAGNVMDDEFLILERNN